MQKKKRKESLSSRRKFCDEALGLVARNGWKNTQPFLEKKLGDSRSFFPYLVETISMESESTTSGSEKSSLQDYLFEKLMARFDALQKNRAGVIALFTACRSDASCFLALEKALYSAFKILLLSYGLKNRTKNLKIKILGILFVYHSSFYAWKEDFSHDMGATMARLNNAIILAIPLINDNLFESSKN